MSDIDFLATNKKRDDDFEPKSEALKKEEIAWSEPEDKRPIPKGSPFTMLSFFSKKKEAKETKAPAVEPVPAIDRSKIRESRQEILKLIKDHERSALAKKNSAKNGDIDDRKTGQNFFARLLDKFKKPPSHKEILIDYHQVFNQEKIKRNTLVRPVAAAPIAKAAAEAGPAKPAKEIRPEPIKREINNRPAEEKKPAAPRPPKENFLSQFFKLIKEKLLAMKIPKLRPVKVNLTEIAKETKPRIAEAPKPPVNENREIKIKEMPLKQTEPVQINKSSPKVLETNLIKGEIITFFDWRKKSLTLMSAILIPILLVSLIYLGLIYYQKQSQAQSQNQVNQLNQLTEKIKQEEQGLKDITDFQARLKIVSQIFAKHIYWTNFFKFLEDNTIKDVYYDGFSGDTSGVYQLSAAASRFSNISEQVDVLRNNQKVVKVTTTGGALVSGNSADKTGVKFNFNLSILKSIFTE